MSLTGRRWEIVWLVCAAERVKASHRRIVRRAGQHRHTFFRSRNIKNTEYCFFQQKNFAFGICRVALIRQKEGQRVTIFLETQ